MPRPARTDIIGKRFERLVVFGITDPIKENGRSRRLASVECDCGARFNTEIASLERGATTSCGCARIKHGHAKDGLSPTYNSWAMMHSRCGNPNNDRFEHYGGRGIAVCERWQSFENFLADMGERPAGMSIERNDTNGNYEPSNCRWATVIEQNRNRRVSIMVDWSGQRITLKEACRIAGQDYQRARYHIHHHGWSAINAIAGELIAYG